MLFKSVYSILQSSIGIKTGVQHLKDLGYTTAIIADNELLGTMDFYNACKAQEMKPIIGVHKTFNEVDFVILAQNYAGYKSLIELVSTNGNIYDYQEKLVYIISDYTNEENAEEAATSLDNVYIGMKISEIESIESISRNSKLEKLAKSTELDIVPLEIAIHLTKEDYRSTNALRAIGDGALYDNVAIKDSSNPEEYMLSKDELLQKYPAEWIKNLSTIVASCENDYVFGNPVPPHYIFVKETAEEYGFEVSIEEDDLFAELSRKGLKKRLLKVPEERHSEYKERLEFEINVIKNMKFSGYMLIVWDYVKAARDLGIPVGPGRGSAAGSLVAYSLEITDIDPIPWNLLFERFLNPERVSMPDIDMDFCQTRRPEVLAYVAKKYGAERVAQIVTFTGMEGKSIIRDCARIFSYPQSDADFFAKAIPEIPGMTLDAAYEMDQARKDIDYIVNGSKEAKRIWEYANKLKGAKRGLGIHAAGVVMSEEPIYKRAPIIDINGQQAVQFEGKYLEDVDLIKFDFLGLKTLSVIDMAVKFIKENRGVDVNVLDFDLKDTEVYKYIATGATIGMFQIEGSGMQDLCRRLKPNSFEDLTAILALYRPGPMDSGMLDDFIERKNGMKEIKYFFDEFEEALKPTLEATYGVIVYQEQVMQIVQDIGGFSLGEADIIRRAMGKKQVEYMTKKRLEFADGAVKKGLNRSQAEELFLLIEKFAGYGFNKSHSAAYAMITYQTAWLKTYYPVEFFAALANYETGMGESDLAIALEQSLTAKKNKKSGDLDKLVKYIQEARKIGITVLNPDVNTSCSLFTPKDNIISFGLRGIKGLGSKAAPVEEARASGVYTDIFNFVNRVKKLKMNKGALEGLIKAGALDSLGVSRKSALENVEKLLVTAKHSEITFSTEDFSNDEKLLLEKEKLGFFISELFSPEQQATVNLFDIPSYEEIQQGKNKFIGLIEGIDIKTSKKGNSFGILKLFFDNFTLEALAFKDNVDKIKKFKMADKVIVTIDKKDGTNFLQDIEVITKKGLERSFPYSLESVFVSEPEVVIDEKTDLVNGFVEVVFGDYEALAKATANQYPVRLLDVDGSVSCTLYR